MSPKPPNYFPPPSTHISLGLVRFQSSIKPGPLHVFCCWLDLSNMRLFRFDRSSTRRIFTCCCGLRPWSRPRLSFPISFNFQAGDCIVQGVLYSLGPCLLLFYVCYVFVLHQVRVMSHAFRCTTEPQMCSRTHPELPLLSPSLSPLLPLCCSILG